MDFVFSGRSQWSLTQVVKLDLMVVVLMGVEGMTQLSDVCIDVFNGVLFRCSVYIWRLYFVISDLPISIRLKQGNNF